MRLACGFWSGVAVSDPEKAVGKLDQVGVRGVVMVPGKEGWTAAEIERVKSVFDANGVFVCEVAQYRHGYLASHDDTQRQEGVGAVVKSLHDAVALEACCVGVSRPWGADGDWWSEKTWTQLCRSLGEIARTAEELDMPLGLHPTNCGPLDSPEQLRRCVDDVASPRVQVLLDPVNMSTNRTTYNTTDFLNATFDLLGDCIIAAHAKDVDIQTRHWVLQLDEVPIGTGHLDYETFLRRVDQLEGEIILTIEHFRDVAVSGSTVSPNFAYLDSELENARARVYIEEVAARIGAAINCQ